MAENQEGAEVKGMRAGSVQPSGPLQALWLLLGEDRKPWEHNWVDGHDLMLLFPFSRLTFLHSFLTV